jgi:signal transduction histidine kinase/HPt (histidine-containing phosphotransfer) domain-containing protein
MASHATAPDDATDRRRNEAFLAGQTWVLELLATGARLEDVLAALAQTVEEQAPGMRCSILLLDDDGRRLRHGAAPGLPEAYCRAIDGLEIGPAAGSCGTAAHRRERVIVADVATDERWASFRDVALAHGLRACWSEPIVAADGAVLGTLAMYYGEPRTPGRRDTNLIVIAAHLAAIAIERKRAERELEVARDRALEAAQLKSQFLANVSHEVRTPMNAIIGMTDLALETELSAEQREYLDVVRSAAHALLALLDDVLDVARIEAGRLELRIAPFALRRELAAALEPLAQRAAQKGLRLTADVAPDVPDALAGDAGRLRQVVTNLVGNGIKFTEAGHVAVRVRRDGATGAGPLVHLEVADTGVGIPAGRLRAIFRPFEQGDGSTTRRFGGAGLGLALAAQVVELMGGRIWVESEPSRGSTFHVAVPLADAGARTTAPTNGVSSMTTERTPGTGEVIDAEAVLELVGGDGDALADLVDLYRTEAPRSVEALRSALAEADAGALSAAAHRLKGSLLTLAAHAASAEALRLEQLGREGRLAGAEAVLAALERQLAAIEPALEALVARARRGDVPRAG